MSESNTKALRKSLRNVVQALLPELLTNELTEAVYKKLSSEMGQRMDIIAKGAQDTLKNIDDRQKDFQSFLVRQATTATAPVPESSVPLDTVNDTAEIEKLTS